MEEVENPFATIDYPCKAKREERTRGRSTHHDLVLPREVGRLAEELRLGHGDSTRGLPNQHCVVEFGTSRGRRAKIFALQRIAILLGIIDTCTQKLIAYLRRDERERVRAAMQKPKRDSIGEDIQRP